MQRLIAMVKAISAAASTAIPAGETTWGAVFIANGLQLDKRKPLSSDLQ